MRVFQYIEGNAAYILNNGKLKILCREYGSIGLRICFVYLLLKKDWGEK